MARFNGGILRRTKNLNRQEYKYIHRSIPFWLLLYSTPEAKFLDVIKTKVWKVEQILLYSHPPLAKVVWNGL